PCHCTRLDGRSAGQRTGSQRLSWRQPHRRARSQRRGFGMNLLEINDVYGGYGGGDILKGVSLKMGTRDIIAIVGPNGAGKSTLMKAAFGLVTIREGSIVFDGDD